MYQEMSVAKKRRTENEGNTFLEELTDKYFLILVPKKLYVWYVSSAYLSCKTATWKNIWKEARSLPIASLEKNAKKEKLEKE